MKKLTALAVLLCVATALGAAQAPATSPAPAAAVSRTTKAITYNLRGSMKVDFHGTNLLGGGSGEAKVDAKKATFEIDAKFSGMDDPVKFGLEYLTYVLWAISAEGRAINLGELVLDHNNAHLKTETNLQTFGMIVTAEPYFAVTQPGNMVVLENVVPETGRQQEIAATYQLLGTGTYSSTNTHIQDAIFGIDPKTPRELFEARNAVRIAHIASGDKYAGSILSKADQQLRQAETNYVQKQNRQIVESAAREAIQTAEEARVMAVKQKADDEAQARIAAEKKAAEDREAAARADADAQAKRRAEAEQARKDAEAAQAQAEQAKAEAEKARKEAEEARQAALVQQQALAEQAASSKKAEDEANRLRQQAEKEKEELRSRLLQQLNAVLATRDTARGLVANMSDVLFGSGRADLLPGARERLAKVSGIVLAYPGLQISVEGHTDSVGTDEYNQGLSERRAAAVRDYLVAQGISTGAVTSRGFGKTQPIATNDTAEGRQQNRRVELVLTGGAIGTVADASTTTSATTPVR